MNVLSVFDGMSCGQIALERVGIKADKYFASEIDKYAIKVTMANYPNTIQLGDITKVNGCDLPKIDLLIGGSPCQGFSVAGNGLNFDDPRSKLFFEYIRVLEEVRKINPDVEFLLENVKMKKEYELIINKMIGVRPMRLNSSLVSAQNRQRLYWTNIPVTKRIQLKDLIESGEVNRGKSFCIDANYYKGGSVKNYEKKKRRQIVYLPQSTNRLMVLDEGKIITHSLQPRNGKGNGGKGHLQKEDQKSYCINTSNDQAIEINKQFRKLTVKECCRLQTVPDNYFNGIVSNTQAYKMLGNGWTVDVIAHIFSFIPEQTKLFP